jgi:hypothetical protein
MAITPAPRLDPTTGDVPRAYPREEADRGAETIEILSDIRAELRQLRESMALLAAKVLG